MSATPCYRRTTWSWPTRWREALRELAGRIIVNAEEGVVVLRGAVARSEDVDEIERRVRRVGGVRGVRNLLHLEGTPAPAR